MAKKGKKNLQKLIKKRQQLQMVGAVDNSAPEPSISTSPAAATTVLIPTALAPTVAPPTTHSREVLRTFISSIFILVLLTGLIILDRRTPFLNQFGNWLFNALRLNA